MKTNMYTRTKKPNKTRTVVIVVVTLLLAGIVSAAAYKVTHKPTPNTPSSQQGVNLQPATEDEKQDSNQHKEDIVKQQDSAVDQPGSVKQTVTPVIVNASQSQVRSYISGVVEDGGTCSYEFANGTTEFTKTTKAVADATTTQCTNLNLSASDFSKKGNWSVTVSYSSPTATGVSPSQAFEVK